MLYVLEEIYKSKKSQNSEYFNSRLQRSLSWLKKAVLLDNDIDLQFMSLWIAFSALLAESQIESGSDDIEKQQEFLIRIYQLDHESKIRHGLWGKAQAAVEFLVQYPYASQDYWDYKNQILSESIWKARFSTEQQAVKALLNGQDTQQLLALLFKRLWVLRQQVLQGGVHYNSAFNRTSLQSSCTILKALLPQLLHILIDHPNHIDTQKPFYPILQLS